MWTGLITGYGSGRSNRDFMSTASSSAGTPSSITVRWPTGLMNPVLSPRLRNPSTSPSETVVLPRFCPVAARYSWRTRCVAASGRGSAARGGLALDELDGLAEAGQRLLVDRVGLEGRPEELHD